MELDQLRSFIAVAEAGGFTRAARRIHATQPTLSRQVRQLEDELGRLLFDRVGRRIRLTDYGRVTLDGARKLIAQADALRSSGCGATGELRIVAADSVVLGRLPRFVKRYRKRHPEVRLHISTARSMEIIGLIREGRYDVGFSMLPETHPRLVLHRLWEDQYVAIAPPGNPIAGKRVDLARFSQERQVVIRSDSMSYQVISTAYHEAGIPLLPDMVFDRFKFMVEFIAAGIGVGITPSSLAASAIKRGKVARVRISQIDALTRNLGMLLRADRVLDEPLASFVNDAVGRR